MVTLGDVQTLLTPYRATDEGFTQIEGQSTQGSDK